MLHSAEQCHITQEAGTERPFSSEYDNFYEKGIYVDIATDEPLFSMEAEGLGGI